MPRRDEFHRRPASQRQFVEDLNLRIIRSKEIKRYIKNIPSISGTYFSFVLFLVAIIVGLVLGFTVNIKDQFSPPYCYLSNSFNYIYCISWCLRYYPQLYLNFIRNTTLGLNIDYLFISLIGYIAYAIYNSLFYYIDDIQAEYKSTHQLNEIIKIGDMIFSIHAVIAVFLLILQCFYYDGFKQWPSSFSAALICMFILFSLLYLFAIFFISHNQVPFQFIDWVVSLSYFALFCECIRLYPQYTSNYRNKIYLGIDLGSIGLDLLGGLASILQVILDSKYLYGDEHIIEGIKGNIAKFGLGVTTVLIALCLFLQYCLYSKRNTINYHIPPKANSNTTSNNRISNDSRNNDDDEDDASSNECSERRHINDSSHSTINLLHTNNSNNLVSGHSESQTDRLFADETGELKSPLMVNKNSRSSHDNIHPISLAVISSLHLNNSTSINHSNNSNMNTTATDDIELANNYYYKEKETDFTLMGMISRTFSPLIRVPKTVTTTPNIVLRTDLKNDSTVRGQSIGSGTPDTKNKITATAITTATTATTNNATTTSNTATATTTAQSLPPSAPPSHSAAPTPTTPHTITESIETITVAPTAEAPTVTEAVAPTAEAVAGGSGSAINANSNSDNSLIIASSDIEMDSSNFNSDKQNTIKMDEISTHGSEHNSRMKVQQLI